MLGAAAPEKALGRDLKVSEALANAEKELDTAFADQPLVEAGVRVALATTYYSLGRYDLARRHATRALDLRRRLLGPEHPDTLRSTSTMAGLLARAGKRDEARALFEQVLEVQRRTLGPEDPETLETMEGLALVARGSGQARRRPHAERPGAGDPATHPGAGAPADTGGDASLATTLFRMGKLDEANALLEQALEAQRRILGPEHPQTLR